jgi:hypothetical protein
VYEEAIVVVMLLFLDTQCGSRLGIEPMKTWRRRAGTIENRYQYLLLVDIGFDRNRLAYHVATNDE